MSQSKYKDNGTKTPCNNMTNLLNDILESPLHCWPLTLFFHPKVSVRNGVVQKKRTTIIKKTSVMLVFLAVMIPADVSYSHRNNQSFITVIQQGPQVYTQAQYPMGPFDKRKFEKRLKAYKERARLRKIAKKKKWERIQLCFKRGEKCRHY